MRLTIAASLVLTVATAAQTGSIVIPPEYAGQEGNYRNTIPFGRGGARYQQLHGGMRGKPFTARLISFRQDGNYNWADSFGHARTVDMEMLMADTDHAAASKVFQSNYKSPPAVVISRRRVSLPDFSKLPATRPARWQLVLPLATPWRYSGRLDWLWEIRVHANSSQTFYPVDGHDSCTRCFEEYRELGKGCTATGQTATMRMGATITSSQSMGHWFRYFFSAGPRNAAGAILIGIRDPNLPVPGLCTRLRSSGEIVVSGTTSSTGLLVMQPVTVAFDKAFLGAKLYGQGVAADRGRAGLPFAASNGTETTFRGVAKQHALQRVYDFSPGASLARWQFNNGLIVKVD